MKCLTSHHIIIGTSASSSIYRDLQDLRTSAPLQAHHSISSCHSQMFRGILRILQNSQKFAKFERRLFFVDIFMKICRKFNCGKSQMSAGNQCVLQTCLHVEHFKKIQDILQRSKAQKKGRSVSSLKDDPLSIEWHVFK